MKYILGIVNIGLMLLNISFNLNAQSTFTTITIESTPNNTKDGMISDFGPEKNMNFGNHKQIIASRLNKNSVNYVQRSLFKFDLSDLPPNCRIMAADLFLYAYDSLGYGNHLPTNGNAKFDFATILEDWEENTVTWENQPKIDTNLVDRQNAPTTITQNYINNPITSLIRNMYSEPSKYFGIMMKLRTEINTKKSKFFFSSD
ncbi:MAG: DNRLRE domain-containing protein [Saprospiraceae bacterium]|nr:DNRLRE domain-containing protein [Saprospiraceae bacterium]